MQTKYVQFVIITAFLLLPFFPVFGANILNVPFTSQAPFGNWASPWQDFCEEASIVMAAHFVWGVPLAPSIADLEMQIIRQYEESVLGRSKDTSAAETAQVLRVLFGFKDVSVRDVHSPEDLKRELRGRRIVIVPVAGRPLQNPYFVPPGPRYHMVVVRGFDDEKDMFIVNDPGTRRGNGFSYPQERLFDAIHDLVPGDILGGNKKMIVVGR